MSVVVDDTGDLLPVADILGHREGVPLFTFPRARLKRTIDVLASTLLLAIVAPLMALIAAGIFLADGGPVVFRHDRLGRSGRRFGCLKFRTMIRDADRALDDLLARSPEAREEWMATRKLRRDPRVIGRIGRFLRRTSLDELPQLLNVLLGQMSLVGPRPVVASEIVHYGADKAFYFSARPGLTGPWQVSGRSDTSYSHRVKLDVDYIRNPSLRRDIGILLRTVLVVLRSRGAY